MISCIYTRIADSINMMFVYLFVCIVMYIYKVFFWKHSLSIPGYIII